MLEKFYWAIILKSVIAVDIRNELSLWTIVLLIIIHIIIIVVIIARNYIVIKTGYKKCKCRL